MVLPGFAGRGKPVTIHVKKNMIQKAGKLVANLARHISCLLGKAYYVKPAFFPGKFLQIDLAGQSTRSLYSETRTLAYSLQDRKCTLLSLPRYDHLSGLD